MQTTLKTTVTFAGAGLHTGHHVSVAVHPAPEHHGICFLRSDIAAAAGGRDACIPARWDTATPARLCTRIENKTGVAVGTIEHLMAALAGCGILNALIEIDGPEVPILDGSAAPFVAKFVAAGIVRQNAPVNAIRLLETVEVRAGDAFARLEPAPALEIHFEIEFLDRAIGRQRKSLSMANGAFVRELSDSRTFCLASDVEALRNEGLALGGALDNALVIDGDVILTPGGLRHHDEPVRHKMLDALGDLALAGAPLLARYTGYRAGHALTGALLKALFARPDAYEWVACDAARSATLPGVGVCPADIPLSA